MEAPALEPSWVLLLSPGPTSSLLGPAQITLEDLATVVENFQGPMLLSGEVSGGPLGSLRHVALREGALYGSIVWAPGTTEARARQLTAQIRASIDMNKRQLTGIQLLGRPSMLPPKF